MDKYVIRRSHSPNENIVTLSIVPKQKQVTIESLSRVVVVEEIKQAKALLSIKDQNVEQILKCLTKLDSCTPSKEVLLETKIGHIVNKLRKHKNTDVKELSIRIFKKWKQFYRERKQRQPIEVRCDAKTELYRMKARRLIADALKEDISLALVEGIERTAYLLQERSVNNRYKRLVRTLTMKLKNNEELKNKVLRNEISPEDICKKFTGS